jgi:hypothetical protein
VVVETSPGHLQAWVQISQSPLEPGVATAAARELARLYGGDPASADWRHLGRLAGFTNQKPCRRWIARGAPWVKVIRACAGLAPVADRLLKALRPAAGRAPVSPDLRQGCAAAVSAHDALAIYRRSIEQWRIPERFAEPDWSIVDLWVARHLLQQGMPAGCVESILRLASPQFPRRHGDPADYLRRTLARAAFPPTGAPV